MIIRGDCVEAMVTMPAASVDAIVTDPPYGLGFMDREWDDLPPGIPWAKQCLRVLKPGGHLLAFGGTRTYHRLACAIEDAGFEIRDTIAYMYGSGFPKAWNFDTQYPADEWCECGNAVPCSHDESSSQHGMRPVPSTDLQATIDPASQRREILLAGVSQQGAPAHGQANGQPVDDGREQSSVDGRELSRTRQGLPNDSQASTSEGANKRLRIGAHPCGGSDARPIVDTGRGSASPQQESGGQSTGEPSGVRKPSGTLDDRALRDGGRCSRCGKLSRDFKGFATALKPMHEPIVVARKPLTGTVAGNVLEHGTGALNVDGCRIGTDEITAHGGGQNGEGTRTYGMGAGIPAIEAGANPHVGRWPANVCMDEQAATILDEQTGTLTSGRLDRAEITAENQTYGAAPRVREGIYEQDSVGASRFLYVAKASSAERNAGLDGFEEREKEQHYGDTFERGRNPATGERLARMDRAVRNVHPTVKPIALMRWLVRLVTPPGGTCLDPFAGSGTTGIAATLEGFEFVGIEREPEYAAIAEARIAWWAQHPDGMELVRRLELERERAEAVERGQVALF